MMSKSDLVRSFIALETPEKLRQEILKLQERLRSVTGALISWVKPQGIHLTLKFLGDVDRSGLNDIEVVIQEAAAKYEKIDLKTTINGGFPNLKKPRILWLGLDGGEQLLSLQAEIDQGLAGLGFELESRKFHPHLTLGRVKYIDRGSELIDHFKRAEIQPFAWEADSVRLISSVLKPAGAEYGILANIAFGG